ncbi:MAG: hypothetical protein WD042_05425 [Phycisphaeraceae bacterium]
MIQRVGASLVIPHEYRTHRGATGNAMNELSWLEIDLSRTAGNLAWWRRWVAPLPALPPGSAGEGWVKVFQAPPSKSRLPTE